VFDPFKDFATAGYLRNHEREQDLDVVKVIEHELFRAKLPEAVAFLAAAKQLSYGDFLEVHRILFQGFYPWAGEDRTTTAPDSAISKGETLFSHPAAARLAVEEGLRIGQSKARMRQSPGLVMGLFAYGHPFLDGNGRTMLVVHAELCWRAGFSVDWRRTAKTDYLRALSDEIAAPGKGILDGYLLRFTGPRTDRGNWSGIAATLPGLDGRGAQDTVEGDFGDAAVADKYERFDQQRGYEIG
jgi:cell filamentation protein